MFFMRTPRYVFCFKVMNLVVRQFFTTLDVSNVYFVILALRHFKTPLKGKNMSENMVDKSVNPNQQ